MNEKLDTKEFELPKTVFSRDIETRVIQVIVVQCLESVEGVGLIEGNVFDTLFGRDVERVKGISVEQDSKNHQVKVKVEMNVAYGISIPEKTQEVQEQVVREITDLTGLHVASVHIVVKGLISPDQDATVAEQEEVVEEAPLIDEKGDETELSEC